MTKNMGKKPGKKQLKDMETVRAGLQKMLDSGVKHPRELGRPGFKEVPLEDEDRQQYREEDCRL